MGAFADTSSKMTAISSTEMHFETKVVEEVQELKKAARMVKIESSMTESKAKQESLKKQKGSGWDLLQFKRHISLEAKPKTDTDQVDGDDQSDRIHDTKAYEINLFQYLYSKITTIIKTDFKVTTEVINRKLGFGFISENERRYNYKIMSYTRSGFFDQKRSILMEPLHGYFPYSEVFEVNPQIAVEIEGKTVFIFRHFLDWNSMTAEHQKSILVASASVREGSHDVKFIKPLYIDEEYCLIEKTNDSWFWVVSDIAGLPQRRFSIFSLRLYCHIGILTMFQRFIRGSYSFHMF